MKRKAAVAALGTFALALNAVAVGAQTPVSAGEAGIGGGDEPLWVYGLAVGVPLTLTLLLFGYVHVTTPKKGWAGGDEAADAQEPHGFDYTVVGNQLVVTYEGEDSWDRDSLVVRCGSGSERETKRFETAGNEVEKGDGLSVNVGAVGEKVEVAWKGEVVDEYVLEG